MDDGKGGTPGVARGGVRRGCDLVEIHVVSLGVVRGTGSEVVVMVWWSLSVQRAFGEVEGEG